MQLESCANSHVIAYPSNLEKVIKLIVEAKKIYPYRLHGMILSHILGAPYEYYPYHHKLKRVHETIKELNPKTIMQTQQEIFRRTLINVL